MGVLSRIAQRLQRRDATAGTSPRPSVDGFGIAPGFPLGTGTVFAENLSAVLACTNVIASTMSSLPAYVYRRQDGGRVETPNHPVSRLIRQPSRHQTWPDLVEWIMAQVLLHGNAICTIEFDDAGRPVELLPVPWGNVAISLTPGGRLAYDVQPITTVWGTVGRARRYLDDEVFHLRDRTDNGLIGRSRLGRAPQVLSQAAGLAEYAEAFFRQGVSPGGFIKHPLHISNESKDWLAQSFERRHAGATNAHKTIILDEGMEFQAITGLSNEASETLASRKFSVVEIARIFQVPPSIIQDYSMNSFTSSVQANQWFAMHSLGPWCRKFEAEASRTLFTDPSYSLDIDLSGLMRGDFGGRWAAWKIAVDAGVLTPDEVREAEGYAPRAAAPQQEGAA